MLREAEEDEARAVTVGSEVTSPQHSLFTVFSKFGLLYSGSVFPNTAVARPGVYAIIKFYSGRDAHRAQKACGRKQRFQSPVKGKNNFEWIIVNFISESGKIALEYRPSEEIIDARTEEELQDLIHFRQSEEECLDFSLEEEEVWLPETG
ncbi:LOW QUALITY PROTEIN: RAD52 motif-containing protein 1 [Dugong dugon]